MPEPQYTRCPACKTVFRVTAEQLAMRDGRVRCGHCKTVFDGRAELVRVAESRLPEDRHDEVAQGPPTMTLRMPHDATRVAVQGAAPANEPSAETRASEPAPAPSMQSARFAWAREERNPKRTRALFAVGIAVLLVLLAGQATHHFRNVLAAWQPATKPVLARACRVVGCTVEAPRDITSLSIDGSDLQADPAHRGLLILSATIRNRSHWPLAYPDLELTLTDARDAVVARRALLPVEYAGGTADLANGIAPNTDVPVKLFIDASATNQAGYRLYLFYP
jgi:predicted Zn finger-like uncharacterized protein